MPHLQVSIQHLICPSTANILTRKRRVKCDERQPACSNCTRIGRYCQYPLQPGAKTPVPTSLGNPLVDPLGTFKRLGAPGLRNLESLVKWLSVRPGEDDSKANTGFLKQQLVSCIVQNSCHNPAMLNVFSYFALKLQSALTGQDTELYALRAKFSTMHNLATAVAVDGNTLVTIMSLALSETAAGETEAADIHLNALKTLYRKDLVIGPYEWIFSFAPELHLACCQMRAPKLPYYVPGSIDTPWDLTEMQITHGHKLAARNVMSLSTLVGSDFLQVLKIFQHLHLAFTAYAEEALSPMNMEVYGKLYKIVYETQTYFVASHEAEQESNDLCGLYRELLAIALLLSAWQTTVRYHPHEGIIQVNLVKHAAYLLQKTKDLEMFVYDFSTDRAPMIWIISIFTLVSQEFVPEEADFWIKLLGNVMTAANINSDTYFTEIRYAWPYEVGWSAMLEQEVLRPASQSTTQFRELTPPPERSADVAQPSQFLLWRGPGKSRDYFPTYNKLTPESQGSSPSAAETLSNDGRNSDAPAGVRIQFQDG